MTPKELVFKAMRGESVDRIPVGFCWHFLRQEEYKRGLSNPRLMHKSLIRHQKFIQQAEPDLVKIMTDGYFLYPHEDLLRGNVFDLKYLQPLGAYHPWMDEQVAFAKEIVGFSTDRSVFYNIFSPAMLLLHCIGREKFFALFAQSKESFTAIMHTLAEDTIVLAKRIRKESGCDGIYFCVKNPQGKFCTTDYKNYIMPAERQVLETLNTLSDYNILHCCGNDGVKNPLHLWADYPAAVFNWATKIEQIDLAEGRKLFRTSAVMGGFDCRPEGILHQGTRQEIECFTQHLVRKNGARGLILGADCTLPEDTGVERLQWVKNAALV
jgi:uroporphyrinogen-III decarboxylase